MARTSASISVGADTRQLERDIQSALARDFKFKGLNEKAFTQPLGRITGAANEFQKSLDASNARVIAFGASAGLIFTVEKAFTSLIKSTIDVQKSLTDINVILNVSTNTLNQFGNSLFDIAKNTGQTFDVVAQAATELSRQGLGLEETLKRTRDALILTRLSGLDTVSAVEALTATINSFNKEALDSTTIINKLANVDAAFAVSSADLAEAIKRVGSSAVDAGVDFDQLLAIVTSVQQTTARGGAVIGNSLKTIFTRIQRTDTLDQLEELGIQVRTLEGDTLPAIQILSNLSNTFNNLADSQRAQVAETVGGVFQINILKAALSDLGKEYSTYGNALKTASNATNEAITRNEALNQTLSSLINKTFANLTKVGSDIGKISFGPTIENLLNLLNKGLESIDIDGQGIGSKIGKGILEGIGSFISGPGVILLTAVITKLVFNLGKFAAQSLQTILNLNTKSEERAAIQAKINQVLAQETALVQSVYNKEISVLDVETKILNIIRQQTIERERAASLSSTLTGGLIGRGVSAKGGTLKAKSEGFIPNFASSEILGALAGGYSPGYVRKMNIPGEGSVTYNSAEKVKKFPGMSQPAIMPPMGSRAGKNYQSQFNSVYGFNPYASGGFIPNFAKIPAGMTLEQAIKGNYSRSVLSSKFGAKAVEKVLGPSRVVGSGAKERNLGFTSAISMIYPAKIGKSTATGAFRDAQGDRYRLSFNQSGFNAKTAIKPEDAQLENSLGKNIIGFVNNYISQLSNGKFPQITDINQLANAGSFKSIVGTVFETAVSYATKSFKPREGGQSALIDFPSPNKNLRELFNFAPGQYEAKGSNNQELINDVARKAYLSGFVNDKISRYKAVGRNKSGGFIPNFTALNDAIGREAGAGTPMSRIRIGKDSRLTSASNPLGLGVYNTKDEPMGLGQGVARYGSSRAKSAGASNGFIPNFFAPLLAAGAGSGATAFILRQVLSAALFIAIDRLGSKIQQSITDQKTSAGVGAAIQGAGYAGTTLLAGGGRKAAGGAFLTGVLLSLVNSLNGLDQTTKDAIAVSESNKDKLETFSSAVQSYNQVLEKLRDETLSSEERQKILSESNESLATILANTPSTLQKSLKDAVSTGNFDNITENLSKIQIALQTSAINTDNLASILQITADKSLKGDELQKFTDTILNFRTTKGTSIRGEVVSNPKLRDEFLQELGTVITNLQARNAKYGQGTPIIGTRLNVGGMSEDQVFAPTVTGAQGSIIPPEEQNLIKETVAILDPIGRLLLKAGVDKQTVNQTLTELEKLSFDDLDQGTTELSKKLQELGIDTKALSNTIKNVLRFQREDFLRRAGLAGDISSSAEALKKFQDNLSPESLQQYGKIVLDANRDLNANRIATAKVLDLQEGLRKSILNVTEEKKVEARYITQVNEALLQAKGDLDKFVVGLEGAQERLVSASQRGRGLVFADQFRADQQAAREKQILGGRKSLGDIGSAFFDQFDNRAEDSFREAQLGAADTARTIKSEFNNAFLSFANGTATASDAFTKMALNISDKIQQLALEFSTNLIFGKLFGSTSNIFGGGGGGGGGLFGSLFGGLFGGKAKGGLIKGYSTGGNVTGGSGTRDDIPAMLSAGEYVIRKSAVDKYGSGLMSMINGGRVNGFAYGGESSYLGTNTYRYNDSSYPTGGENVFSSNLGLRAILDPNNPQNRIRQEREQTLISYLQYVEGVNESNRQALDENIRLNQEIQNQYNTQKSAKSRGAFFQFGLGLAGAGLGFLAEGGQVRRFASGGSSKDDIPAMLMGGEFVMRKEAVNLYGKKFFDDLNSGRVKRFAEGGGVGNSVAGETSGNYSPTNNVSVVVNMNQQGGTTENTESNQGNQNSEANNNRDLAEKIKTQVIRVITDQQRPGGLLSSAVYRKQQR
jgi:TP901 family phage tail tape measure protein